ncbi:MAG: hypothetical protein K2X43_18585 [Hyphomonadaceae bacterium]|jgi:hypothetical protein|nr:hypothetical protein [Hyphomonadaceae bacterium]
MEEIRRMRALSRENLEIACCHAEFPRDALELGAIDVAELTATVPPLAQARKEMVGCSRQNGF